MQSQHIEWEDHYQTGIDFVDAQHRELFRIINDLHAATLEGATIEALQRALRRLRRYALEHFAEEEGLMERVQYPGLDAHRSRHAIFIENVQRFEKSLEDKTQLKASVLNFLRDWVRGHIRGTDRRYLPYVEAAYGGEQPDGGGIAAPLRRPQIC